MKNLIRFLFLIILFQATAQADNFPFTPGSGRTAASDSISSVEYQRHKITLGADNANDGDVSATNPMPIFAAASTAGGYTPGFLISAATTNATSLKASAGKLGFITVSNVNAAARYLKIYDKSSAPTVGSDTPKLILIIPGNTAGAGNNPNIPPEGLNFTSGIAFAITTGATVADTGAVAANELIVNYGYK